MFVAKWEPGMVPAKPELSSAPIWLELRNVPLQFFHEEGLEHIAGLVGDPKFLHPSTANKTNLEVAKIFTLIDPRKPLPEAVNVQFDSGQVRRVLVLSLWMPPVCEHCKEIGHHVRRCSKAPITCKDCNSSAHSSTNCPRAKTSTSKRKYQRKKHATDPVNASLKINPIGSENASGLQGVMPPSDPPSKTSNQLVETAAASSSSKELLVGECSGVPIKTKFDDAPSYTAKGTTESDSEVEEDSSDILSSDPDEEASLGD